jgi:imidazole glycerol-phosphate synthase subunit HisH
VVGRRIAIVDYGMGNTRSVAGALLACGHVPVITSDPAQLADSDAIILPGVGSFRRAMERLHEGDLVAPLTDLVVRQRRPFLGICLGMHVLAELGTEGGDCRGLGWIPGRVVRLKSGEPAVRIPHVGWNEVQFEGSAALLTGLDSQADFYFAHSYHFLPGDESIVLGRTSYGDGCISMVKCQNIYGVQFHPEKSQRVGLRLLGNFATL